jgi:hypothetical protein
VNWARVITTLVSQLAARVGKSRATPICPFFYHLYEQKELLKPEEEKSWKIQEGMLKYGESGSKDEGGSGSGSDDEEDDEEEEEEETQVLLNRPPKRPKQEDKSEQIGALPRLIDVDGFHSLQGLLMLMASRVGTLWSLGNLINLELNLCSIESNEGVTTNIIIIAPKSWCKASCCNIATTAMTCRLAMKNTRATNTLCLRSSMFTKS